ncbi:MAG: serine/threonine protein kinase, partial [Myxococcales bacterium]|nr:serine/threonine protein kinase [Myxococcales bacterium]
IAMEYVAGDTLETWLGRGRRTWSEVVEVFAAAARGLAAVHTAGLVHRDFKPGNVIVRDDGTVQVLDFGLATQVGEVDPEPTPESFTTSGSSRARAAPDLDALAANLTTTGAFMGTPAYMAPEQFMMLPTDGRADQFSLCVALYEALYGHRPFKGRDLAQLMAATLQGLPGTPPELPGVPLAVRQVIARGLARAPEDRFPDMGALVEALVQTRTPTATAGGGWRRFALGALAGGGALAIVAGVWLSQQGDEAPTPVVEPPPAPTPPRPIEPSVPASPTDAPRPTLPSVVDVPAVTPIEPPIADPSDVAVEPTRSGSTTGVRPASTDARGLPQAERPTTNAAPGSTALPSLSDLEERDEPAPAAAEPKPAEPEVAPLDPPSSPGAPPAP